MKNIPSLAYNSNNYMYAFCWNGQYNLVCSRSALCVLVTQNVKTCSQELRFNKLNDFDYLGHSSVKLAFISVWWLLTSTVWYYCLDLCSGASSFTYHCFWTCISEKINPMKSQIISYYFDENSFTLLDYLNGSWGSPEDQRLYLENCWFNAKFFNQK